jgi:hypothetical protein
MGAIEYCVNFKGCMYVIVDLIIFVFADFLRSSGSGTGSTQPREDN